ncbi:DNA-7-methylguanine glycosylase [Chitinophaga jiangningensis]|uniref:DNA-7-methylguanine glycosylase n=1 Tax=Chitinophaga jiangningensis TaxID=1419482 RepID=A0A1M7E2H2_9BACT|nr:DNA alkylation repair protein [Chitinophaga jiangningensis]SHL85890.1 DNA-7-methylguanine glycosylase [Chitinophaga jiangningensis]
MEYLQLIVREFETAANATDAIAMKKYMRDQFEFCGIKSPRRKLILRELKATHGVPPIADMPALVKALWKLPQREYQYAAVDMMQPMHKQFIPDHLPLFEFMMLEKSWWDTVDNILSALVSPWFKKFPELRAAVTDRWIASDNRWLQRGAIIYQNGWKLQTDEKVMFQYILQCNHSKEFFIQKAIGWALREYSKVNPAAVKKFVAQHPLAPLSKREALRLL